jgi:hypothetical protein
VTTGVEHDDVLVNEGLLIGVKKRDHSGKPHKTSPRDNRTLSQSARRRPFSTARRLRDNWAIHGRVSVRTVSRRLNCTHLKA